MLSPRFVDLFNTVQVYHAEIDRLNDQRDVLLTAHQRQRDTVQPFDPSSRRAIESAYAAFSRVDGELQGLLRLRRRILGEVALVAIGHAALVVGVACTALWGGLLLTFRVEGLIESSDRLATLPLLLFSILLLFGALGLQACDESLEDTAPFAALDRQVTVLAAKLVQASNIATCSFWTAMLGATPTLVRLLAHIAVERMRL